MQEEIGTGGAGFRFIFSAFLQESSEKLKIDKLNDVALEMTKVGDKWRNFAVMAGRICKGRQTDETYPLLADYLCEIFKSEIFYQQLEMLQSGTAIRRVHRFSPIVSQVLPGSNFSCMMMVDPAWRPPWSATERPWT